MRKKYYHAATPETMEKIIADGVVKRGWDGCVYLCEKPQDAAKFVAIRGHDEVAVIEVILPANKVKECFRLQGWTDDYFEKAEFVNSDSQLYKQAGNGVTVTVIEAMARKLGQHRKEEQR